MSRPGRIGVLLLELSPLITAALVVALWFAIPGAVRGQILAYESYRRNPPADVAAPDWTAEADPSEVALNAYSQAASSGQQNGQANEVEPAAASIELQKALGAVWLGLKSSEVSAALEGRTVGANDPASQKLAAYERRTGAQVYTWVASQVAPPRVAWADLRAPGVLLPEERSELASGTAEMIRQLILGRSLGEPKLDVQNIGGTAVSSDGERTIDSHTWVANGQLWEVYDVYISRENFGGPANLSQFSADPMSAAGRETLERYNRGLGGNLIVVGPVDTRLAPLRFPSNGSKETASGLAAALWPAEFKRLASQFSPAFRLSDITTSTSLSSVPRWALLGGAGRTTNSEAAISGYTSNLPPIVAVALFDRNPAAQVLRERFGAKGWARVQTWIAVRYIPLMGAMFTLFLVSLVVAPVTFVVDRRATADREAEREKERIQREAHDRVFGRLGELSSRVERAGTDASAQLEQQLGAVAADIDETLKDLKTILGQSEWHDGDSDE